MLRFANADERRYMIAGAVSATLAGITFPFFVMFFGQITNIFSDVDHAAQKGFNIMVKFVVLGSIYWIFGTSIYNQAFYHSIHGVSQAQPKALV